MVAANRREIPTAVRVQNPGCRWLATISARDANKRFTCQSPPVFNTQTTDDENPLEIVTWMPKSASSLDTSLSSIEKYVSNKQ
ncbi:hypothetical protein [Burkholderia ubonensis]|uniref:hypothetical protein n=1 Tax=Burkholderia ubonensis TaxID=101571 RepID=UPI0012F8BFFC|nr:hypothetical protein [Burkholderia ubonensis]